MILIRLFTLMAALGLAVAGRAQRLADRPHVTVELRAQADDVSGPDKHFTLAIVLTPRPGWHTYWSNPGDAGVAPRVTWRGPIAAGALRYPTPKPLLVGGLMNHVYDDRSVLLVDGHMQGPGMPDITETATIDLAVCSAELCVPESATVRAIIDARASGHDPVIATARAALPRSLPGSMFERAGSAVRLSFPLGGPVIAAHFFADADGTVAYAAPQHIGLADGRLVLATQAFDASRPGAIDGVLRIERPGGAVEGYAVHALPGRVAALAVAPAPRMTPGIGVAFMLALTGGLLLNVMPCVFPILSLKALSLARSGESAGAARREALAYAAGVVGTVMALGGGAIAVAHAGGGAGWAAPLQNPRVIAALILLVLAIALNFAGLFEAELGGRGLGQSLTAKPGAVGAFFTGTLAAVVATPCTGPFMAGALGAALVLPPLAGLAVFAGLGLGLALPFLLVGFVPTLRRRLPRPGPWMAAFRRWLALPMFATALGLAWVLGRQAGVDALVFALGGAAALGVVLWWLGRAQGRQPGAPRWLAVTAAAAVAAVTPLALPAESAAGPAVSVLHGQPWSEAAVAAAVARGQPAFVYFTADWCLTCKVNEHGALASPAVATAFTRANVQVLAGDWTRPDPAIARFLAARGRAGIPLYLFYRPDGSIEELPQLLTEQRLLALRYARGA